MNSLASILYTSTSVNRKKRQNRSLKPAASNHPDSSKSKLSGMLFRSSTPKTSLRVTATHPVSSSNSSPSSSAYLSNDSSQSPRCSTPVFARQRRTRPFIVCELCRKRAFQSSDELENKNEKLSPHQHHHHHRRSTTLFQNQKLNHRRRSSIAQLLVWIV